MSGHQLLQLVTEMRRALAEGSQPQKIAWQNHRALGAAETAFRDCLEAVEDEVAILSHDAVLRCCCTLLAMSWRISNNTAKNAKYSWNEAC